MRLSLKKILPTWVYDRLRPLRDPVRRAPGVLHQWLLEGDSWAVTSFVLHSLPSATFAERCAIARRSCALSLLVNCPHTQAEVLSYVETILSLPPEVPGVIVEAGCYKGGSTAKFSIAADLANRELVVFDSFCGIPANEESHGQTTFGQSANFLEGSYRGTREEVAANVAKYGKLNRCRFVQGWFDDTMPHFHEPIAAAYIDVDLVSSTKTCLKYIYPLLQPGGVLYSQDGHLPLVIEALDDDMFWENEVGCKKPSIVGLGKQKLIKVIKDASANLPMFHGTQIPRPDSLERTGSDAFHR